MTYRVQIGVEPAGALVPDLRRLGRLARWVLNMEGASGCELGVLLTDDEGIRALNRRYLDHDWPTDVLAFPMQEKREGPSGSVAPEKGPPYLGDVVISLQRAQEQADTHGHAWSREVELLLVHGLLHLLGYRDAEEPDRRRMEERQEHLLTAFSHRRSTLGQSFRAAFVGLADLVRTQRNARIHLAAAVLAIALAVWLRFAAWEWAALVLTIALVLLTEAINSAIEALVDLASPEIHPLARRSKDLAAAAVLLVALFSLVVGAILFLPHLWEKLP